MRILLVEPYGMRMGHFGFFAAHLGQELSKLGHEVTVVTGTRLLAQEFLGREPLFRLHQVGCRDVCVPTDGSGARPWAGKLLYAPALIWINTAALGAAAKFCAREHFDVVHLLDWEALSTAAVVTRQRLLGRTLPPLLIHINPVDFSLTAHPDNRLRGLYKICVRGVLRWLIRTCCAAVTVQGEWHRQGIAQQLCSSGPGAPPVVVVRPGTTLPQRVISCDEARRRLGLPREATVFLFFGTLRKDKGIDLLIEAIASLAGDWQLLIVGAVFDCMPESLAKQVAHCRQPERVRADLRYIPEAEVGTYFAAADAAVFPYRGRNYLGNYGPMILACGYGKPVIASDVGEMGRLIREYALGYAVRPDDLATLRMGLQSFLALPAAERQQIGARARRLAEECSFARMANQVSKLYASLLSEGNGRHPSSECR